MLGSFNILGLIYNGRKVFLAVGVLAVLQGYYHDWHTKPLFELRRDLKRSRELVKACENSKAVEVFATENSSVFNNYRETIKEMEDEEFNISSSSNVNFDWMYR